MIASAINIECGVVIDRTIITLGVDAMSYLKLESINDGTFFPKGGRKEGKLTSEDLLQGVA